MTISTSTTSDPWYDVAANLTFQLATNKDVLENGPFTVLDPNRRRYYEALNAVHRLAKECMRLVRVQAGLPVFDLNKGIDLGVGTPADRAFRAAFLIEKACGHHNPAWRSIDLRWLKAKYDVELRDVVACLQRAAEEGTLCPKAPTPMPSTSAAPADVGSNTETCAEAGASLSDGHSGQSTAGREGHRLAETETDLDPEVAACLPRAAKEGKLPPEAKPSPTFCWRRCGDMWELRFDSERGHFSDLVGFGIIAKLLRFPNPSNVQTALDLANKASQVLESHTQQHVIDEKAKKDFEQRLKDCRDAREEAEARDDAAAIQRVDREVEVITEELRKATGLRGRPRNLGAKSPAESARTSITKAKQRVIKLLEDATPPMPELAQHLTKYISPKDNSLVYQPPSDIEWVLD